LEKELAEKWGEFYQPPTEQREIQIESQGVVKTTPWRGGEGGTRTLSKAKKLIKSWSIECHIIALLSA